MKKLFFLLLGLFLLIGSLAAQHFEYMIDNGLLASWFFPATTHVDTLTGGNWDDGYFDLELPAANQFYFYGKRVSHLRIFTNGFITLGFGSPPVDTTAWLTNQSIPTSSLPNGYVAPWWDDWNLDAAIGGAGEIWYSLYSSSDLRFVTVQWMNVAHYHDSTARYRFQVNFVSYFNDSSVEEYLLLYKNAVLFIYDVVQSGTGEFDLGASGTIGVEDSTGTYGTQYSYNTPSLTPIENELCLRPFVPIYDSTNFSSGGRADIMIYRPSQGVWKINDPSLPATQNFYFGGPYDIPLPGDFDGDGTADPCVFRPSQCRWRVQAPDMDVYFGKHGDIPVPADYDGDGRTDIAVFRPMLGVWKIRYTGSGTIDTVYFGTQGDIPVPYDYDGDLSADIAIVRPGAVLGWRIQYSGGGSGSFNYGVEGDIPVPGDWIEIGWNGNAAIWRPSDGTWRVRNRSPYGTYTWGTLGDIAVPGDFNISGMTDYVIWRPSAGMWRIRRNTASGPGTDDWTFYWGRMGDIPRCRYSVSTKALGGPDGR